MINMVAGLITLPSQDLNELACPLGCEWFNRFRERLDALLNRHGVVAYHQRRGL
jgi:hypothetical protein